jgi:hypothetical protein
MLLHGQQTHLELAAKPRELQKDHSNNPIPWS